MNPKTNIIIFLCFLLGGCNGINCCIAIPITENSSNHYVIFGVGIISIPKSNLNTAILATKAQTLGILLSDQPGPKFGLGYTSANTVSIPDGAHDVRVEVSDDIGGKMTITSPSAELK